MLQNTEYFYENKVNSSLYQMMDMAVFMYYAKKEIYENAACSSENQVKRSLRDEPSGGYS